MTHDELLETINRAVRDGLTKLDLAGQDLTSLPPEIGQLSQLTELILSKNKLTNLPESFGQLSQLKWFFWDFF
jgi:internalin A